MAVAGSVAWDVKTAKGSATVVAHRLDTKGCSSVLLPESAQGLSGKWKIWTIMAGNKIPGIGGASNFAYNLTELGSSIVHASPGIFRSRDIVRTI